MFPNDILYQITRRSAEISVHGREKAKEYFGNFELFEISPGLDVLKRAITRNEEFSQDKQESEMEVTRLGKLSKNHRLSMVYLGPAWGQ
jgi:hypothetical protein